MLSPLLVLGLTWLIAEFYLFSTVFNALAKRWGEGQALLSMTLSVILSALVGIKLIRAQGVKMLIQTQKRLAQGAPPSEDLLDGVLVALGGLALVVPGYASDILGLIVIVFPFVRRAIARRLSKRFSQGLQQGHFRVYQYSAGVQSPRAGGNSEIIDVDAVEKRDPVQLP
jgi:UPF0716 family protein affecting phage T7 exclusion